MKVLVVIDAEGCGVYDGTNDSEAMQRELSFFIKGLEKIEVDDLIVYDFHGNGNNLTLDNLTDERISLVNNAVSVKEKGCDCAAILGMHPKAGADFAFSHSFRDEISEVVMSGKTVGELSIILAWLEELSIPTLFVTGTVGVAEELQDYNFLYYLYDHSHSDYQLEKMSNMINTAFKKKMQLQKREHQIMIKFHYKIIYDLLNKEIFEVKNGSLIFHSALDMMESLFIIMLYIDMSNFLLSKGLYNIMYKLKKEKTSEINPIMQKERIFFKKRKKDLNLEELMRVQQEVAKMKV